MKSKKIDWEAIEVIIFWIAMFMCAILLIYLLFFYDDGSFHTTENLEITDMHINETSTFMYPLTGVPTWRTNTNYYIVLDDEYTLEVSASEYESFNIGDIVSVDLITYVSNTGEETGKKACYIISNQEEPSQ